MVKKRGIVWNYFNKKVDGTQVIAFCKFCDQSYIQNATRMERHMERCQKCPEDVRREFIEATSIKKNKSNNVNDVKKNDNWNNQEEQSAEVNNVDENELNDLDEWGYRNEIYDNNAGNNMQPNVEIVVQNGNDQWNNRHADLKDNELCNDTTNREWETSHRNNLANVSAVTASQERGILNNDKNRFNARKITPCSTVAARSAANCSNLQNKIYQEELLERRAARRIAELELRRKTLEFERFQWEYERDKNRSEVRWAHETRMMQLKEERERQIIEQNRTRLQTHVM